MARLVVRSIANAADRRTSWLAIHVALLIALFMPFAGRGMVGPAGAAQGNPAEAASPAATPGIGITGIREIELEFDPILLSPDGAWIAGTREQSTICLSSLVDEGSRCQDVPSEGSILPESIAWAPDSSAIAFSLDALPTRRDSDIFVLNVDGADLVDLTPDPTTNGPEDGTAPPVSGGSHVMRPDDATPASNDPPFWLDVFPAWSPDGKELVFARYALPDGSTGIMRISRSGGEPTTVLDLASNGIPSVLGPILWPEDDTIIFSGEGSRGSIHEASLASGDTRLILESDDPDLPGAVAVSMSADGEWLSVYSSRNVRMANAEGFFGLVERETGEILIFTFAGGLDQFLSVVPRFGPEGLFVSATMAGTPQSLFIWDIATGRPVTSAPLPGDGPDRGFLLVGLSWATNGTILVPGQDESAHIVEIDVDP